MKTLRYVVILLLSIALPFVLQRWDRQELTEEQRSGTWNAASWAAALYAFGPFSMVGWCWVTRQERRRWRQQGVRVLVLRSAGLVFLGFLVAAELFVFIDWADSLMEVVLAQVG